MANTNKDFVIRARVDEVVLHKLDAICQREGITKSEFIRNSIETSYEEVAHERRN